MDLFNGFKNFLGINIKSKKTSETNHSKILSTVEDGSTIIDSVGPSFISRTINTDYIFDDEVQLIKKYRDMSLNVDCDRAINNIVNEIVNIDDDDSDPVTIDLDRTEFDVEIKEDIIKEFDNILSLTDFRNSGAQIIRDWYIDGRLFFQKVVDKDDLSKGLIELRRIDSLDIRKIKQVEKVIDPETGAAIIDKEVSYFLYAPTYESMSMAGQALLMSQDSIAYCHSGLYCYKEEPSNKNTSARVGTVGNRYIISYLHPAIKPLNQLSILEDASIIYRISRSSEKRVHYIDINGLPKNKAESAMQEYVKAFQNQVQYNTMTGEIDSTAKVSSLQEDIFVPRRNGTNAAEISTLPAAQNLGEIEDINYFKIKLYKSLNVPLSRLNDEAQSFLGKSSEINRDELNFSKFINTLRRCVNPLWNDLLKTQLLLKNIIKLEDWNKNAKYIDYTYSSSAYITRLRELEMLSEKVAVLRDVDSFAEKYFSKKYIYKNILGFTDEQIQQIEEDNRQEPPKPEPISM